MADYIAYFNGEWVASSEVKIGAADRGFSVSDAVFDVERTFNGKGFRLKEHIDRLYRSLQYVRIEPDLTDAEMLDITEEAIRRNEDRRADVGDFHVDQFVTRGQGPRTWSSESPTVCVKVSPLPFGMYAHAYSEGMPAAITRTLSYSPQMLDPKVKHHSRMNFNLAELEANDIDPGAWPILRGENGNITEGSGYNVLIVTDGVIRSATDTAILQGVSRGMVFDLADQLGIPRTEEDLQPYDVYAADEVFFTSTSYCVLPVTRVDKRQIGDGKPGPFVECLLAAWSKSVGVDIVDQAVRFARPTSILQP